MVTVCVCETIGNTLNIMLLLHKNVIPRITSANNVTQSYSQGDWKFVGDHNRSPPTSWGKNYDIL